MNKVSWKGVIVGGIVDVGSSLLLSVVIGIFVGLQVLSRAGAVHTPPDQMADAARAVSSTTLVFVIEMLVGFFCSILGGYVAARMAQHDDLLNGLLSAWLCTLVGILGLLISKDTHSMAFHILGFVGAPLCSLLGGYFSSLQRKKQQPLPSPTL